jgi:hypothetical protein
LSGGPHDRHPGGVEVLPVGGSDGDEPMELDVGVPGNHRPFPVEEILVLLGVG